MNFHQDERYIQATDKEKCFLDEFATDKDIARSVGKCYDVIGDRETQRRYGLTVLSRERIAGIVRDYIAAPVDKSLPTRDELRHHYMELFHNAASTVREKLQALTAYERVSGFNKTVPKSAEEQYDALDDIVG